MGNKEDEKAPAAAAAAAAANNKKGSTNIPSSRSVASNRTITGEEEKAKDKDDNEQTPTNEEENTATQDENKEEEEEEEEQIHLSKTIKLNGYIVLLASSAISLVAAINSDTIGEAQALPANSEQRSYAIANASVVVGFSLIALFAHLDRFTCLKGIWVKLFKPKALFERLLLIFLVIWCFVAVCSMTTIEGIAGDGNGQYDLYFTIWVNCIASIWTLERHYVYAGKSSLYTFMSSWPHRAPAWIALFILSLLGFCFFDDLRRNYKNGSVGTPLKRLMWERVEDWKWVVTFFVYMVTLCAGIVFSLVELFRHSRVGVTSQKATWETWTEGALLLVLVGLWLFCVAIVTTPGGLGSLVGNTYFFTWATALVTIETFLWWVRDWRRDIHAAAEKQHEEYRKAKEAALARGLDDGEDDDWHD